MSNGGDDYYGEDEQTPFDEFQTTGEWKNKHYIEIGGEDWGHRDKDGVYGGVAWLENETFNTEEGAFFRAIELINKQINSPNHISGEVWERRSDRSAGLKAELGEISSPYLLDGKWNLDYRVFVVGGRGDY